MKKILVLLLVCLAIPLYVWDTRLLLLGYFSKKHHSVAIVKASLNNTNIGNTDIHFIPKGRSPFLAFKEQPRAIVKTNPNKQKTEQAKPVTANLPAISINGIMWNESNPVVIINMTDGSSVLAKVGQVLPGGITVKAIQKNQVQVEFSGNSFWLKK